MVVFVQLCPCMGIHMPSSALDAGSEQFTQDSRNALSSARFLGSRQTLELGLYTMAVVAQTLIFLYSLLPPPFPLPD